MIERGAVYAGQVIPGSEGLILRRSDAWWSWERKEDRPDLRLRPGRPDLRPSPGTPVTLLGTHWTGGPIRVGDEVALRTVEAMRARRRDDGALADVSCHLVTGWDGQCWQVADFAWSTVHMGRAINRNSIGMETAWPGYASQARDIARTLERRGRPVHPGYLGPVDERTVHGRTIEVLRPSPELVAGVVRVAEWLSSLATTHPELNIRIPRELAGPQGKRGMIEHHEAPGSKKDDAAGYFADALEAAGWARR